MSKYERKYTIINSTTVFKSYEKYGNDMVKISIEDFKGKDALYRNSNCYIKHPDTDEYILFRMQVSNVQHKKSIKEPEDRTYETDINTVLRVYSDQENTKENKDVMALKLYADAYAVKIEELVEQGLLWENKDKKIKKHVDGIVVASKNVRSYMLSEDAEGNALDNPIAYVSFENHNKLNRLPTPTLINAEGLPVKYMGSGNPDVVKFKLNVNLIQIYKTNATVNTKPKFKNPDTGALEEYNNVNIQHLITYDSLLTGTVKFQIVASKGAIKLSAFWYGNLYVLRNNKKQQSQNVDLSIVHAMQNSSLTKNIEDGDEDEENEDIDENEEKYVDFDE